MSAIDKAIAYLSTQESINISATARKYGIVPCTLNRRWHRVTTTAEQADDGKRFLNKEKATQLINYINELTGKAAPLTPAVVAAYATQLSGRPPGHNWTSRFVSYHSLRLASGYLNTLNLDRHQANLVWSYEQYYQPVNEKL